MILFINTTIKNVVVFGISYGRAKGELEYFEQNNNNGSLLLFLDMFLKDKGISKENIKGIVVCNGPGSFCSIRSGVTMANALAMSLQIPIAGVCTDKWHTTFRKHYQFKTRKFYPVAPDYHKEPNITARKY